MLIFGKYFREYISHIFVCVLVAVDDYLTSMQISTVVIANVDMLSPSFDDFRGDKSVSTMIVAIDWQQW
jgi:hypothetical protein